MNIQPPMQADSPPAVRKELLRADTLIIGFTGSLGSGCTFLSEGLKKVLGDKAQYYLLSKVLRETARQRGLNHEDTAVLQDLGNELREKEGVSALAQKCIEQAKEEARGKKFDSGEDTIILVDGIRNDGEIRCFRQFPNFYLISVHAEMGTRIRRLVGPDASDRRFDTKEKFEKADERDQHEEPPSGQQVLLCNYLADVIINNDEQILALPAFQWNLDWLHRKVGRRLIAPTRPTRLLSYDGLPRNASESATKGTISNNTPWPEA